MSTTMRVGHALCATLLGATLILSLPARVHAQRLDHVGIARPAATGSPAPHAHGSGVLAPNGDAASKRRSALIGGVIGGVGGAVACTVFATLLDDSAVQRIRACPTDSFVFMVAGGFAIGALIGWLIG